MRPSTSSVVPWYLQPEEVTGEPDEVLRREPLLEADEVGSEQPRRISARNGICMNSSIGGNGMWRKKPIRRSGRRARSIAGTSCSW